MSKHTPGPWEVYNAGATIGTIAAEHGEVSYICNIRTRNRADSALIAAAPDLLEIARTGLSSLESELALILESHCKLAADLQPIRETLDEDMADLVADLEAKIAQARAAIAKATSVA